MKGGGAEVGTRDRSFETKPRLVPVANNVALVLLGVAITAVSLAFVTSLDAVFAGTDDSSDITVSSDRNASSSEFVLPESNSRLYSQGELESLSSRDLYVAINEIYARHGRGFNNDDLADHFASCSWYVQRYTPEEFDAMPSQLNEFEQANLDVMVAIRSERDDSVS